MLIHKQLEEDLPCDSEEIISFIKELESSLPDTRDNRGKRHGLAFVVACFVLATLCGRHKLSSIHRFMGNRLDELRTVTNILDAQLISRAQLPRVLDSVDWVELNAIIQRCFGVRIAKSGKKRWVAIDGKAYRGSQCGEDKQSIVLAVDHKTRETVAQARQIGTKSSEIPVVRALLKETELESQKISLDAHHCNPETTAQIAKAEGIYLVQVKENQAVLLRQCEQSAATQPSIAEFTAHEKANGRITSRRAEVFSIAQKAFASRWKGSHLATLVVMTRDTFDVAKQKKSVDTSYYVSNQSVNPDDSAPSAELVNAIQEHWGVESNNWIRDVTFNEDKIKVIAGNQAQVMGRLRGLAIELTRKTGIKNLQAAIERFMDIPDALESFLRQVKFL